MFDVLVVQMPHKPACFNKTKNQNYVLFNEMSCFGVQGTT